MSNAIAFRGIIVDRLQGDAVRYTSAKYVSWECAQWATERAMRRLKLTGDRYAIKIEEGSTK